MSVIGLCKLASNRAFFRVEIYRISSVMSNNRPPGGGSITLTLVRVIEFQDLVRLLCDPGIGMFLKDRLESFPDIRRCLSDDIRMNHVIAQRGDRGLAFGVGVDESENRAAGNLLALWFLIQLVEINLLKERRDVIGAHRIIFDDGIQGGRGRDLLLVELKCGGPPKELMDRRFGSLGLPDGEGD